MSAKNVFVKMSLKGAFATQMKGVNNSLVKTQRSAQSLNGSIGKMSSGLGALGASAGVAALGFAGLFAAFNTFTDGLRFVEDFNQSIVTMTGFISSFSKAGQEGDFVTAFKEANAYAEALIPKLEIMDARTIATGRDLSLMAETMAQYGVWIDLNNKKQEDGFVNMANALAMLTAGQQKQIQMRQEMHALLAGQMRMTDRLPKLLDKLIPNMKQQLEIWREEGTLVENVGEKLEGFGMVVPKIEKMWAAVGTTMQTIYRRILRGGMEPAYTQLLEIATKTNKAMMDAEGNLSSLAKSLQDMFKTSWVVGVDALALSWEVVKDTVQTVWNLVEPFVPVLKELSGYSMGIADGWGLLLAVLNPISARVGKILSSMLESSKGILALGKQAWSVLSFDRESANYYFKEAKKHFEEGGKTIGQGFSGGLQEEIDKSLNDYTTKRDKFVEDIKNREIDRALEEWFDLSGDAESPDSGGFINVEQYTKNLTEVTKLKEKFVKDDQRLREKLDSALESARLSNMKDGVEKELAANKSKWVKLKDSSLAQLKEMYLSQMAVKKEAIIEANRAEFEAMNEATIKRHATELESLKERLAGEKNYAREIAELDHRQNLEAEKMLNDWLASKVLKDQGYLAYRKTIIDQIVAAEKAGAKKITDNDAEETVNRQQREWHAYEDKQKAFHERFASISDKLLGKEDRQKASIIREYGDDFLWLGEVIDHAVSDEDIARFKRLRDDLGQKMIEDIENVGKKAEETFGEKMKDAFDGWGRDFSRTLNDLVWEADASFNDILVSFGKMITQMMFQEKVVAPIFRAIGGDDGFLSTILSANGKVLKGGFKAFANGGVVTKPTLGLVGEGKHNEAIIPLPDGRSVPVTMNGGSNDIRVSIENKGSEKKVTNTKINFDPRGMIVSVFLEDMEQNGPMRQAMAGGI